MTLAPMWRKCPKCKRMYSWNPDVGKIGCPHCGKKDMYRAGKTLWDKMFGEREQR